MSGSEFFLTLFSVLYRAGGFVLSLWWIYLPLILFPFVRDLWLKYKRNQSIQGLEWVLLEIKPPQNIKKTPYSMEQFFASLHGTQSTPNWKEQNISGDLQKWFSVELASLGGEIRFFIRTVKIFRDIVEANIYAQYPEAEIEQVNDYTKAISADQIESNEYDLWGTELELVKEDCYPIRTYYEFEKETKSDDQRVDVIAALLEVMSRISGREQIWIQTLIRPVMDSWKKEGETKRDELIGRPAKDIKKGELAKFKDDFLAIINQLITGQAPAASEEKKETMSPLWNMTKAEQDAIYAIERNISKLGYETIIRIVYSAPKEVFAKSRVAAIIGAYKQLNTQNLNALKPNGKVTPRLDYFYQAKKIREKYRKRRVLEDYKKRDFVTYSKTIPYLKPLSFEKLPILKGFFIRSNPFVFNIEELATIYHFPGEMVKTPLMPQVEAKKGQPPAGLPLE